MKRITACIAVGAIAALAVPASSMGSDNDIRRSGHCTGASTSKIKVKPDNGGLEVEFEVDQNRNGAKWKVKLKRNSDVFFKGTRTTRAPSGSFSVERRTGDSAGTDRLVGIARNKQSGERCSASVSI